MGAGGGGFGGGGAPKQKFLSRRLSLLKAQFAASKIKFYITVISHRGQVAWDVNYILIHLCKNNILKIDRKIEIYLIW